MKATLVQRDGDRATVRLTPSWLARLFGARETECELVRDAGGWRAVDPAHAPLIRSAIDSLPAAKLPRAIARRP